MKATFKVIPHEPSEMMRIRNGCFILMEFLNKLARNTGLGDYLEADILREILDPMFEGESSAGFSDVGNVSWKASTVEFGVVTWMLGAPAHSWQAVVQGASGLGHKSLLFAAKTIAGTALDLMTDPEMLKRAQDEHRKRFGAGSTSRPCPRARSPS